jgi:hypothetical protein
LTTVHERRGVTELVYASAHATANDLRGIFVETPRMLEFVEQVLAQREDDWAIAHELAHQYWGNLVTCVDWSEF